MIILALPTTLELRELRKRVKQAKNERETSHKKLYRTSGKNTSSLNMMLNIEAYKFGYWRWQELCEAVQQQG